MAHVQTWIADGDLDDALVVKLTQEINVEKDLTTSTNSKSAEQKKGIDDWIAASGFEVMLTPSQNLCASVD